MSLLRYFSASLSLLASVSVPSPMPKALREACNVITGPLKYSVPPDAGFQKYSVPFRNEGSPSCNTRDFSSTWPEVLENHVSFAEIVW